MRNKGCESTNVTRFLVPSVVIMCRLSLLLALVLGPEYFSPNTLVPASPPPPLPSLSYQHDLQRTNEFFRSPISVSCLKKLQYITTSATCRTNYKLKAPTNNLYPAKWPSRVAPPLPHFSKNKNGVQIKVDPFSYHILPYIIKNFSQLRRYYLDHIFTNLQSTKILA